MSDKPKETFVEITPETHHNKEKRTLIEKLIHFLVARHVPQEPYPHADEILKLAKIEIEKAFPNQNLRWNEKGLHYSVKAFKMFRDITANVALTYLETHDVPHKTLAIHCLDPKTLITLLTPEATHSGSFYFIKKAGLPTSFS